MAPETAKNETSVLRWIMFGRLVPAKFVREKAMRDFRSQQRSGGEDPQRPDLIIKDLLVI